MKRILSIALMFCFYTGFSQTIYNVERLSSRIRFSGESVKMKGEPNIGFLGLGYEVFGLFPREKDWYFGANSYSALTGIRSGFFVLGVSTGIQKSLIKDYLSFDLGVFLGGGGGSGAPDGGGLMIRPHFDIETKLNNRLSLRAGLASVEFPSGAISSLHANIGLSLAVDTYFTNIIEGNQEGSTSVLFNKINISMLSTTLSNFSGGPLKSDVVANVNAASISLIGIQFNRYITERLAATIEINGAYKGGVDGFMTYMSGLGYEFPLLKNNLILEARALIGGAGGGDVAFGGGLAAQVEAGLGINLKNYTFKIGYGKTWAPNGNFESNHVDISLGKTFKMYKNPQVKEVVIINEDLKKEDFSFTTFNRSYFSGNKKDKNGLLYDDVFNNVAFEIEKKFNDQLSLVAATVWAYQGSYGAYAEGWLGLQYYHPLSSSLSATAKTSIGAGGGGGIDLGSGLAYQYALGLEKQVNKRWSLVLNLGQVRAVDGNFTPVLLDIGVKLNLSQLVKK